MSLHIKSDFYKSNRGYSEFIRRRSYPGVVDVVHSPLDRRKDSCSMRLISEMKNHSEVLDWYDIGNKVARKVVVHKYGNMNSDMYIELGVGVYTLRNDGSRKDVYSWDGAKYPYMNRDFTRVTIHALVMFMLYDSAWQVYKTSDDLQVNHLIIPKAGITYLENDPFYLEVVTRRQNIRHRRFIHRWGLYGVPVSAFMVDDLEGLFYTACLESGVDVSDTWREPVDLCDEDRAIIVDVCWGMFRSEIYRDADRSRQLVMPTREVV